MTPIKVELQGVKEMQQKLALAGQYTDEALEAAIYTEGQLVMTESKRRVPVDMGPLRASGQVEKPDWSGSKVYVTLGFGDAAARYALYVHEGTGPAVGRPAFSPSADMVEAIREWAHRHGIEEEAAYPIARAIGQSGLPPLKYLEKPLLEATAGMLGRIAARIKRALR